LNKGDKTKASTKRWGSHVRQDLSYYAEGDGKGRASWRTDPGKKKLDGALQEEGRGAKEKGIKKGRGRGID